MPENRENDGIATDQRNAAMRDARLSARAARLDCATSPRPAARRRMFTIAKQPATKLAAGPQWLSLTPGLFVVLWSTGFIGAKYGLPYAEPLTFLTLRFSLVAAVMLVASLALGAAWPLAWRDIGHIALVGIFIQATYLGGVFYGIAHGVSAGVAGLIAGLQPLITAALVGIVLGEAVTPRQWLGIVLGFVGL